MTEEANLIKEIKKIAAEINPWVIDIRRDIHAHPELSMEEKRTGALVAKELQEMGLEVTQNWVEHGVVGILKGNYPGPTIMIRADMDALPIQEETDLPYASKVPGVMHACGHDGHVAAALGAAKVLSGLKEHIHGTIKFFFQPSEEINNAAYDAIQQGVLNNPKVDYALGMHVWGSMKKGIVGVRKGPIMSSPCKFKFRVIGKGGHGSAPNETIDPVAMTICAINNINMALNRQISPFDNTVISFCSIHGGQTYNIIPGHVDVEGTIRAFDKDLIKRLSASMEKILAGVTQGFGGTYEFEFDSSIPPLINDSAVTEKLKKSAEKVINKELIVEMEHPVMGSEDYAYFAQEVPSSYFFLGISDDMDNPPIHHNKGFAWDDSVLKTGVEVLAMAAIDILKEKECD